MVCVSLVGGAVRQRQDPLLFPAVIERMKAADFIETSMTVERVEVIRVARCELVRLQITGAQVRIAKCFRALAREQMKAHPAPGPARDPLGFSKKGDKKKQNEISIDLRLKLQIARKIFRSDFADSAFELKRRVQRMIQFLHEHDQRPDIAVPDTRTGIVLFELFNEPARIINSDIELISCAPQKCASELAQFDGGFSSQDRQLRATRPINKTIFQIDSDLRVGSLK